MRPLILVTNDDGIGSPALRAAAEALEPLGDLLIVAPRTQQTSMSRAFPKSEDVGIIDAVELEVSGHRQNCYAVHGSPAHAVAHGVLELATRRPSLCVSGINYGENLGTGLFPSGTVGAALEAFTYGVPGLAINVEASIADQHSSTYSPRDWAVAVHYTRRFASAILKHGLPDRVALLNVNIPANATPSTEVRITSQSKQDYFVFVKPIQRDLSKSLRLKVKVKVDMPSLEPGSDIYAFVVDRVVSVTPVGCDLTVRDTTGRPIVVPCDE